ncbi:MAG: UvrD-helicase domain-containing protein, partial [Raoultibacter sp.]
KRLLLAYEEMVIAYEGAKQTATLEKNRIKAEAAIEALQHYLASGDASLDGFIAVLDECDFLGKLRGTLVEETLDYQNIHAGVAQETFLAKARPLLDDVLALAEKAQTAYDARKRQAGVLDNDDLLKLALVALSDETIARDYRDRFKLVMVDEFQDTSQLQIEIVRHLAGPGLRYLCTVGDAQQSIYRFRGADVNVYKAFREDLESPEIVTAGGTPALLELTSNFRSHADVLSFVKCVSSQEQVFGDSFLDLQAVYDGRKYRALEPRIQLIAATVPQGAQGKTADIVEAEAYAIAQYFLRLHEAGHPLSDMAVLLGRMAYAEVYAQAIRDVGFPCIIAGGSLFHKAHEVRVVERLLRALADINDTQALFEVLTSDMFELSADEMLELATGFDEDNGIPENRKLSVGFMDLTERASDLPGGLKHAVALMAKAQQEVRFCSPSAALLDVLLDSGWISRLEANGAEGVACIANILKAVRFVEAMEVNRHFGIARCANEFSSMITDGMKEAPGALSADGQEAVKIMTIHASKGLEFPLVALARFAKSASGSSNKLIAETIGNETYISLAPPASLLEKGSLSAKAQGKPYMVSEDADSAFFTNPAEAKNLIGFHAMLEHIARREAAAEEQRLFYVGATRAKESLAVVMGIKEQKTDPHKAYHGALDDIRSALFGEGLFPDEDGEVDYGGSAPAVFSRVIVDASQFDEGAGSPVCQQAGSCDEVGVLGSVSVPAIEPFELPKTFVPPRVANGLFSYSSIAESHAVDAPTTSGPDQFVSDADKATDFGSAFHRLAQLAARHDIAFSQDRFSAVAATYGIKDPDRLKRAVNRWFDSAVCTRALSQREHRAEVPFCVSVADEYLEGEIDLFCTDDSVNAFIVDYKTGGSSAETEDQLHEKHLLQAQCYAYATLGQGFESVE